MVHKGPGKAPCDEKGMPCESAAVPAAVSSVSCRNTLKPLVADREGVAAGTSQKTCLASPGGRILDFRTGSAENGALRTVALGVGRLL